jgi:protein-S-isoprenylcysteine O-methyltransferase Ste14
MVGSAAAQPPRPGSTSSARKSTKPTSTYSHETPLQTTAGIFGIVTWLWIATFIVWAIGSIVTKQTIGSFLVAAIGPAHSGGPRHPLRTHEPAHNLHGVALTVIGLALALWGRFYLGGNWSAQVELKRDHQLIRTGPYAIVRHPIYSGFMLAALGTAFVYGELHELLAFVLILIAWTYKSRLEEAFLVEQFGADYHQYRKQVKGLIPFVW